MIVVLRRADDRRLTYLAECCSFQQIRMVEQITILQLKDRLAGV